MPVELSEQDALDFEVISGTIFSLAMTLDYLEGMQAVFSTRKANYVANKGRDAEKSCQALQNILLREFKKVMSKEEREIVGLSLEAQKNMIYALFSMEGNDQRRMMGLINKIKKEKA